MFASFNGWKENKEEKLKQLFVATCYHEAGHVVAARHVNNELTALNSVVVEKPDNLGFLAGKTGVDLAKLPERTTAIVAFGGFLAEAKWDAETNYGRSRFNQEQWDNVLAHLNVLMWSVIDLEYPDRLFPIFVNAETENGQRITSGCVTAIDLLHIPESELDDDHLLDSLKKIASELDDVKQWKKVVTLAEKFRDNPGVEFSKDQIISLLNSGD